MHSTPRSRWLRLALAVLALVASNARLARAALGDACPRTGAAFTAAAGPRAASVGVPEDAPVDPSPHSPAGPELVAPCAASAAAPSTPVGVPSAATAWMGSAPVGGPEPRPASHAPPPPFHPPRAI